MLLKSIVIGLLLLTFIQPSFSRRRLPSIDYFVQCHEEACGSQHQFNCECERDEWLKDRYSLTNPRKCIPERWTCDGIKDCPDGSDELDCICSGDDFQCSFCQKGRECYGSIVNKLFQCISNTSAHDSYVNCYTSRDQIGRSHCESDFFCNGLIDCPWISPNDEANCDCPSKRPERCGCNEPGNSKCQEIGPVCFRNDFSDYGTGSGGYFEPDARCNLYYDCADRSDENGCSCPTDKFTCQCYRNIPVSCDVPFYLPLKGCIPMASFGDGTLDCVDGSDETPFRNQVHCDGCDVTIYRFDDIAECYALGSPACDPSTCYFVPALNCSAKNCMQKEVICVSYCPHNTSDRCRRAFQCGDGTLLLITEFCNGKFDCPDRSDELHDQDHAGFTCIESRGTCVLPQRNLYDDVAQCSDLDDLCLEDNCFECFDKRLTISSKQVCDGTIDCYDFSDECLCQLSFNNAFCKVLYPFKEDDVYSCPHVIPFNSTDISVTKSLFKNIRNTSVIACRTKYDNINATLCDGVPECRDFSDECNCPNPPKFCNDSCHTQYPMGDRYCDGIIDDAYILINDPACPRGFDELDCPKRFKCKAGTRVSISIDKYCNGKNDCDDSSDETNCSFRQGLFSSDTEMIENVGLRLCFWFIGFTVIAGNTYVLVTTTQFLRKTRVRKSLRYQFVIVLNIAAADLIMGFYLLTIASYSEYFSGYYGDCDLEWRSSAGCSVIGSLAVISSEASCFLMVLLTGFRLFKIMFPINALTASTMRWKIGIVSAWLLALILALTPLFKSGSSYFTHEIWFSNRFTIKPIWNMEYVIRFACRLSQMNNVTINSGKILWESYSKFLKTEFLQYAPKGEFGYYGETSVCLPRFFARRGETAWGYSLLLILINFLCFVVIAVSYLMIYLRSTRNPVDLKRNLSAKQEASMQKRIAVIIFTDSLCWIPICIMAFVKLSGFNVSDQAYVFSAALLLPINSAFNPLLYSTLSDRLFEFLQNFTKTKKDIQLNTLKRRKTRI